MVAQAYSWFSRNYHEVPQDMVARFAGQIELLAKLSC
jgi:hypothetical protein